MYIYFFVFYMKLYFVFINLIVEGLFYFYIFGSREESEVAGFFVFSQ